MLTEVTFNGGSLNTTADVAVHRGSPRVIRCVPTSSINVDLPTVHARHDKRREGGPWFIVVNVGSANVRIRTSTATILVTLTPNNVAIVSLRSATTGAWSIATRALFGGHTFENSPRDAIATVADVPVVEPFCFVGDDCEFVGAMPLDGLDDRPMVVAPFFQDPIHATNERREAIRAGDIIMPDKILIRLREEDFEPDPAHPSAGTVLSAAFYRALYNNDSPRVLTYLGTANGTSRNPMHMRMTGGLTSPTPTWSITADIQVRRHIWELLVPYQVGQTTYNVRYRFVMEHTVVPEPVAEDPAGVIVTAPNISQLAADRSLNGRMWAADGFKPRMLVDISGFSTGYNGTAVVQDVVGEKITFSGDGLVFVDDPGGQLEFITVEAIEGGAGHANSHLHGAGFYLWVSTDELPGSGDPVTFQAAGFTTTNSFTLADPVIWGSAPGVSGGGDDDKGCHPRTVLLAYIPTTFHRPVGHAYVPLIDREYVYEGGDLGRNRVYTYKLPNCMPWTTTPQVACVSCAGWTTLFGNVIFGWETVVKSPERLGRGMTIGGDLPESQFDQTLLFENGLGVGRTYLKPLQPGWDEAKGEYVPGPSRGLIAICVTGTDWPKRLVPTCKGHPAEPFDGIGGSHRCFKTSNAATTTCCISVADARLSTTEWCTKVTTVYGDFTGFDCQLLSQKCEPVSPYDTLLELPVKDYEFHVGEASTERLITWLRLKPNPDQVKYNLTYQGDSSDIEGAIGSWSFGATIIVSAVNVSVPMEALILYKPVGSAYVDMTNAATCETMQSVAYAVGVRVTETTDLVSGYFVVCTPSTGSNGTIAIKRYVNNTVTVLASVSVTDVPAGTGALSLQCWGTRLKATWNFGGLDGELVVDDCEILSGGYPALGIEGTALSTPPLAEFTTWVVTDDTIDYRQATASLQGDGAAAAATDPELLLGYGQCTGCINCACGTCCSPPRCNCSGIAFSMHRVTSTFSSPGNPTANTNPTWCGGPFFNHEICEGTFCGGGAGWQGCSRCPEPFDAITVCFQRCWDTPAEGLNEPKACTGLTEWYYIAVFCESPGGDELGGPS